MIAQEALGKNLSILTTYTDYMDKDQLNQNNIIKIRNKQGTTALIKYQKDKENGITLPVNLTHNKGNKMQYHSI